MVEIELHFVLDVCQLILCLQQATHRSCWKIFACCRFGFRRLLFFFGFLRVGFDENIFYFRQKLTIVFTVIINESDEHVNHDADKSGNLKSAEITAQVSDNENPLKLQKEKKFDNSFILQIKLFCSHQTLTCNCEHVSWRCSPQQINGDCIWGDTDKNEW